MAGIQEHGRSSRVPFRYHARKLRVGVCRSDVRHGIGPYCIRNVFEEQAIPRRFKISSCADMIYCCWSEVCLHDGAHAMPIPISPYVRF